MVKLLSILLFLAIFSKNSFAQDFAIRLSLPKDTFQVFETIDLDVELINNQDKADSIHFLFGYELGDALKIYNIESNEQPKHKFGMVICLAQAVYEKFRPHGIKKYDLDLSFHQAYKSFQNHSMLSSNYYPPGRYSIECDFDLHKAGDKMEKVKSSKIYFNIVEPKGNDFFALKNFERIILYKFKDITEGIKFQIEMYDLIKTNINSIYLDRFLYTFLSLMRHQQYSNISYSKDNYVFETEILKLILETRPNDNVASKSLYYIRRYFDRLNFNITFKEFLKEYSQKLSETKVGLEMQEILKTL